MDNETRAAKKRERDPEDPAPAGQAGEALTPDAPIKRVVPSAPPPPHAPGALLTPDPPPVPELFGLLLGAMADPAASEAGLTPERIGAFAALLPLEEQQAAFLRFALSSKQYAVAEAFVSTALKLRLRTPTV